MEIGALKRESFEVWVPFLDAEVLVRHISLGEIQQITKKATRREWDGKHQPVERYDAAEANRLLGREAVRGWKGFTMDGVEFPYTPENCDILMTKWVDFVRFIGNVCTDLQALVDAEKKEREKNS